VATFLLTWNSKDENWKDRKHQLRLIRNKPIKKMGWWTGHTKKIRRGDRVYMLKQGSPPNGIVASGWAETDSEKWRPRRGHAPRTGIHWTIEELIDHETEPILSKQSLLRAGVPRTLLHTVASGVQVPAHIAKTIERLWARHLRRPASSQASETQDEFFAEEGEEKRRWVKHRKREAGLRNRKIQVELERCGGHLRCEVPGCGFDFLAMYGSLGRGYAEVHHLRGLASRQHSRRTRLGDLVIVCANCHRMIHRGRGACRPLDGLIPKSTAPNMKRDRVSRDM